jgi:phosphatidylserine/phosphatidylglycerophosphate/cardiolipin synthase-like enzyme
MSDFQVVGKNKAALFTLKLHRGDGMTLLAMDWKDGMPPRDFVGFAIEYKEPGGERFFALKNRLGFPNGSKVSPNSLSTLRSPIQKFRWVHFPRNAELDGEFAYRVTPVFMNTEGELSYGEVQRAEIELRRETYPGQLNVAFTRGFISSQAFVDRYGDDVNTLIPAEALDGLTFEPTHEKAGEALRWMGFEARSAILELLDNAIADKKAKVRVVAYDLNEPEIVSRLVRLGKRLQILIDDDGKHGDPTSAESTAAEMLARSAGDQNVRRQHMGGLQHNKTIVVDGPKVQTVLCGSTNFSWRGVYVQNNNAIVMQGKSVVGLFTQAFTNYWDNENDAGVFGATASASWTSLGLKKIDAQIGFSPRTSKNAVLNSIAGDIASAESSLLFSLAFLYQTPGAIQNAVKKVKKAKAVFSYGISDHEVKALSGVEQTSGIDLQKPDGSVTIVSPGVLSGKVPEPFKSEPAGGSGTRMHHKFVVIDFDLPTARVYVGSFNFSVAADTKNGENLLLIKDRRIATSYMVEAVRIFDHYHFRLAQRDAKTAKKVLQLALPPANKKEKPWWEEYYAVANKIRDRKLFA